MSLYRNKSRIESARLKNWDYRNEGAYFITICTKNRQSYFGECNNGEINLSNAGLIADKCWIEIPDHFTNVRPGVHIVMPNHVHGILVLTAVETLQCNVSTAATIKNKFMSHISPKPGSVSTIIRSYKSACTKWLNKQSAELYFGWQERFHDHIIRNEDEYKRIENYILHNPKNWISDKFFSKKPDIDK